MSASTKKKLRREQNAAQLTEKQLQEQKEAKKLKKQTLIFTVAIALILVASIVLGNMFGIIGMILSIPVAAILSFIYNDYLLPRQEEMRRLQDEEEKQEAAEIAGSSPENPADS